jgi:hypothetical protein
MGEMRKDHLAMNGKLFAGHSLTLSDCYCNSVKDQSECYPIKSDGVLNRKIYVLSFLSFFLTFITNLFNIFIVRRGFLFVSK